jgi:hypothetical protein
MNIFKRYFLFSVVIACAAIIPALTYAQGFEGVVTMQMKIPVLGDQTVPMVISIKGDKTVTAMDIPMQGSMKMYADKITKKTIMVMEGQKIGMEIDQDMAEAALKGKTLPTPKPTGKKETIKGYSAEEFSAMMEGGIEINLWMTKDMPKDVAQAINASSASSMQMIGSKSSAFQDLYKQGYISLRTVVYKDGNPQVIVEYASSEKKKLDDAIFVVPKDITIQKLDPSMMNPNSGETDSTMAPPPPKEKK